MTPRSGSTTPKMEPNHDNGRQKLQQQWEQLLELLESRNRLLFETENSLRQSQEFLDRIINTIADPVFVKDHNFRYLMVNSAARELMGLSAELIIGKNDFDFLPVELAEKIWKFDTDILKTGNGCRYDLEISGTDSRLRTLQVIKAIFTDSHGGKFIVGSIRDITGRIEAEQQKTLYSRHLVNAIEQERSRLARELHDVLGHALTEQSFGLKLLQQTIPEKSEQTIAAFEQLQNSTQLMVKSLQRICTSLRPSLLDELGLCAAVEWLAEEMSSKYGIECNVDWHDSTSTQPEHPTELFRIIQESLNNILKHSRATKVSILFSRSNLKTTLEIGDNGSGFDSDSSENGSAFGIIGMHERANLLGGKLEIKSQPAQGTTVSLTINRNGREAGKCV